MTYDIFYDFCIAGLFVFVGQLLRSKVNFLQRFFVPAGLIGGIIGFILGPEVIGLYEYSEEAGNYAGLLVVVIFAALGYYGIQISKGSGERILSLGLYELAVMAIQVGPPILISMLFLNKIQENLSDGFGLLLVSGFYGGHGTAAAVGSSFEKLGYAGATDIALTFATIGILTSVFGGIYHIKRAVRKGYTCYVKDYNELSGDLRTGMLSIGNRPSMGEQTTSPVSLDSLTWHVILLLIPCWAGIKTAELIEVWTGVWFADFMFSYLYALIILMLFKPVKLDKYVDEGTMDRLSGLCTDFVIVFGVSRINIAVIVDNWLVMLIMTIIGWIIVHLTVTYFGPRMNKESWFERSIFTYGYSTGVQAMGIMLLRIVDPENKSLTLQDMAVTNVPATVFDFFVWGLCPTFMMTGHAMGCGIVMTIITAVFVFGQIALGWWYPLKKYPLSERKAVPLKRHE